MLIPQRVLGLQQFYTEKQHKSSRVQYKSRGDCINFEILILYIQRELYSSQGTFSCHQVGQATNSTQVTNSWKQTRGQLRFQILVWQECASKLRLVRNWIKKFGLASSGLLKLNKNSCSALNANSMAIIFQIVGKLCRGRTILQPIQAINLPMAKRVQIGACLFATPIRGKSLISTYKRCYENIDICITYSPLIRPEPLRVAQFLLDLKRSWQPLVRGTLYVPLTRGCIL